MEILMSENYYDVEFSEAIEDLSTEGLKDIAVFSRDWTVETIVSQITKGNIDLNPKFQRRNVWTDAKKSAFIESLIGNIPVPEIILAENPHKKKSFIVVDGKQRLLTIAGFINPQINTWDKPQLKQLKMFNDLNGKTFDKLGQDPNRYLTNASLRCSVISNYQNEDVIYQIFYRLNTGSVKLSSQELRNVLHSGEFTNFLFKTTNSQTSLHKVLNINAPDARMRDMEILLRLLAFEVFPNHYTGNLKNFLDIATQSFNEDTSRLKILCDKIDHTIETLVDIFGDFKTVGRKYKEGQYETRFNVALFECLVCCFNKVKNSDITPQKNVKFKQNFQELCTTDRNFLSSIESSTKNIANYKIRYTKLIKVINESYDITIKNDLFITE